MQIDTNAKYLYWVFPTMNIYKLRDQSFDWLIIITYEICPIYSLARISPAVFVNTLIIVITQKIKCQISNKIKRDA